MPSPSKTIKALHRKQGRKLSLKAFAREAKNDKQYQEVATAWLAAKFPPKKAAPAKPQKAAAPEPVAPAGKAPVLKKKSPS